MIFPPHSAETGRETSSNSTTGTLLRATPGRLAADVPIQCGRRGLLPGDLFVALARGFEWNISRGRVALRQYPDHKEGARYGGPKRTLCRSGGLWRRAPGSRGPCNPEHRAANARSVRRAGVAHDRPRRSWAILNPAWRHPKNADSWPTRNGWRTSRRHLPASHTSQWLAAGPTFSASM